VAIQTSFAKKVTRSQDCDDCFLPLLRNDGEFYLALLDVKNRICNLFLREDNLILWYLVTVVPPPTLARNILGSNETLPVFFTTTPLFLPLRRRVLPADEGSGGSTVNYSNSNTPSEELAWS
jgi:hypothetical protein